MGNLKWLLLEMRVLNCNSRLAAVKQSAEPFFPKNKAQNSGATDQKGERFFLNINTAVVSVFFVLGHCFAGAYDKVATSLFAQL